jgi:hypothetical protein
LLATSITRDAGPSPSRAVIAAENRAAWSSQEEEAEEK